MGYGLNKRPIGEFGTIRPRGPFSRSKFKSSKSVSKSMIKFQLLHCGSVCLSLLLRQKVGVGSVTSATTFQDEIDFQFFNWRLENDTIIVNFTWDFNNSLCTTSLLYRKLSMEVHLCKLNLNNKQVYLN